RPSESQHAWEAPRLADAESWTFGRREPQPQARDAGRNIPRSDNTSAQPGMGVATSRRPGRVAGFARKQALRALGNANPPQVAELIGRAILAAHQESAGAPCP